MVNGRLYLLKTFFQDAGFPPKRVATPRQRSKRVNQDHDEPGSESMTASSNNQEERSSPQSDESSQSIVESSQEPRTNKRSKLSKASKRKAFKSNGDGGASSGVIQAVEEEETGREVPGNGGLEGADLQPGHESDESSADTEPYDEGEGGDGGVQAQAIDQHGSLKEYGLLKDVSNVLSGPANNLMKMEELVEEVQEVVMRESNDQENGEEGTDIASDHGGEADKVKMLRFYQLLKDAIEDQEAVEVADAFARLGLASKQRSANHYSLAASLPRLEPGQAFNVTTKKALGELTISVDVLHRAVSEMKSLGLHQSSSLQTPVWVPLVKQRRWPIKSSTPVLTAPVSTRLPRKAKTEALAKQVATSFHERDMRRTPTTSSYNIIDNDDDDFVAGPPPFKAPKFKFSRKDKEEAELEKVKKDSLFDNLRDSQGTSASGSSGNDVHDVVGNILQANNLHLSGISISLVQSPSVSSTTNRKRSEEDEVEILNESIKGKRNTEAGTSSSTSSNFRGSCPLCNLVFEDSVLLETHASTCDGQSVNQVK